MVFEKQDLGGVYIITPELFEDERGYFFESFRELEFQNKLNINFVQDNQAFSKDSNVIRGLHYQIDNAQGKLIHVISGAIKDVVVDIRIGSPNFGKSFAVILNVKNHKMLYVPEGFAHGYLVLEKDTVVHYKCTNYYNINSEFGIRWNDPEININWGISNPILSDKDKILPYLRTQKNLPKF
ncbi:MAG: dTDP-4-dehydrorhamnose 3,5-epimerase [Candidatus Neomarinimicrobiota bacterium]